MKRKITLFLLALSTAALLAGCKKNPPETEAPTEAPTEAVIETEPPTEAPTETEKEDSMNKTRELQGLVKASDTSSLTIQTARGKELTFDITGADIQLASGIETGINVKLLYKGKISDTDTSAAKVLMVVDLDAGETPVTEGELQTEGETADPDAGAGTLTGTIEDISVDRIVILADDGSSYYFTIYEAAVNLVNGMQQGNYVTVDYVGDIHGPDLVAATAISDNDPAAGDATVNPGATMEGASYISGTVSAMGMTTMTITTDDGEELTFDTTNATHCYTEGVQAGSYLTIEYTGELSGSDTTGVSVVAVYNYTDEASGVSADDGTADNGTADDGAADDGTVDGGAADDSIPADGAADGTGADAV